MEEFRNAKARQALVSMLADRAVQEQVLLLLIRNPWPSDLPDIFKHLASDTPHAWTFVKALDRYGIRGAPVHQELPPAVGRLDCYAQFEGDDKFAPVVRALKRSLRGRLVVDADLQPTRTLERRASGTGILGGGVASVLEGFTGCSYSDFGERIEYYTEGDEVHICSIGTARRRWLSWYEKHHSDIVADGPRNPF